MNDDDTPAVPLRLLAWPPLPAALDEVLAAAGIERVAVAGVDDARARLHPGDTDLALLDAETLGESAGWPTVTAVLPVVLQTHLAPAAEGSPALWEQAVALGVQDVLVPQPAPHAQARRARLAYATDLATGLPHGQQLLEHMSHLVALREREPAPMAVLVLRIEGFATAAAAVGAEAAAVLRRKFAVRLRAGLRASDVVASLDGERFAVLLSWIDAPTDVAPVVDKLLRSLRQPFVVAGQPVALALAIGARCYPDDGREAGQLLDEAARP
ncbi:diguanylate cyclase [Piscinibacter sakaiensis]|uniref:diguanylate cyclase domain-containing protein n=1 Tax=Piscinibacter sakaiensis TaxID=1547922 RepID=UPI00372A0390